MSSSTVKSSRYAFDSVAASPGVSLERGNYRMRAPNLRPLPSLFQGQIAPVPRPSRRQHRVDPHLVFLVIVLSVGCLGCFITAYYLFSTRWATLARNPLFSADFQSQVTAFEDSFCSSNASQRFLTYLPHSGFHNQRIAFENALILAHALNRTLLVPPIRLGKKPIRYVEYNTLLQYIEISEKHGLKHCPQLPQYLSRPEECLHYFDSAYVPWTWLVDLSPLTAHQTLCHLPTMTRTWIGVTFDIAASDIYTLKDSIPYQFRFVDTNDTSSSRGKYQEDIFIGQLTTVNEKLLQMGTLFGTSRISLKRADSLAYRDLVRESMVFVNKELSGVAASISSILGKSYISLHIRSGDGLFQAKAAHTVNSILRKTLEDIIGLSAAEVCYLEKILGSGPSPTCTVDLFKIQNISFGIPSSSIKGLSESSPLRLKCSGKKHALERYMPLNIPLYIATDLPTPATNPLLSDIQKTFPCTFFLGDFGAQLNPLRNLNSVHDNVNIYEYSLPFIDALVASRASWVVGTEGSTFSKFVEDILWGSFRRSAQHQTGLEI